MGGFVLLKRLQKVLAEAGVASRRAAEEIIRAGRVKVDGRVVSEMGAKADPDTSRIEVDGHLIRAERKVYFLLYKPVGYVTTKRDPLGRRTVLDLLPGIKERIFPVGRLDYDTAGVLLLTNDGDLAHALLHPRHGIEKTYRARVKGIPSAETLQALRRGIILSDGPTAPAHLSLLAVDADSAWLEITIREGRNRQIRRMGEAVGHPVFELIRTHLAFLNLKGLVPGRYRPLQPAEVARLKTMARWRRESIPSKKRI